MPISRIRMHTHLSMQPDEQRWPCRTITTADVTTLGALMLAAYRGTIDYGDETLEQSITDMQAEFDGSAGQFLPACSWLIADGGKLLAACFVTYFDEWQGPLIAQCLTHPDAQNHGMGTYLIQRSMDALLATGYSDLYLAVTIGNAPAQHLYEKLGFREDRRWERA